MRAGSRGFRKAVPVLALLVACTSPVVTPGDDVEDPGGDLDVALDFAKTDGEDGEGPATCAPGPSKVRFKVDDTANRTYGNKEMRWTGSFAWDEAANTIAPATSWLPTDGPFPWLYDDGPASAGGHEPGDAVAGDHVFEIEVGAVPESADLVFEYGVLNKLDGWIWIGPNGKFTVSYCSPGTVVAAPLTLPAFGDVDLKLTLDLDAMDPAFAGTNLADSDLYLKSSANSWAPVQLTDDGDASMGDEVAGDGIVTFVQSKRLGPHDGLLAVGQHAQFVFAIAPKGGDPADALEYKSTLTSSGLAEGVTAYTDVAVRGTFAPATIVWEKAARGREFNTTVIVGGGLPWCQQDADCFGGATCGPDGCASEAPVSSPSIATIQPATGPAAGGTAVVLTGTDFRAGATVTFDHLDATGVTVASATRIEATTPAHAAGKVDVVVRNVDGGIATAAQAFEYTGDQPPQSHPVLNLIDPVKGPVSGGTDVTLTGSDFREGCTVKFGTLSAAKVVFVSATEVTATTSAAPKGIVDVVLTNPDLGQATYPNAFEFVEPQPPAVIDWGRLDPPLSIEASVGDALPDAIAQAYEPGVTTGGGGEGLVAAEVGWGPAGSDPRPSGSGWTWAAAAYDGPGGDTGNNAVFRGTIGAATAGDWSYTFRFSLDGGTTWTVVDSDGVTAAGTDFDPAKLGALSLAANDPEAPSIGALAPDWSSCLGGATVTMSGARLDGATTISVGGVPVAASVNGAGTSLTFTAPAHPAGVVTVSVTNGAGKTAEKARAFSFAPKATTAPAIDGTLGGDWDASFQAAQNGVATTWTDNTLDSLWVAYDDTYLYVGVAGKCQADNAIVAYLDRDYGKGTGVRNLSGVTDVENALDNAVSSLLAVSDTAFGADKAVGTKGMASYTCTDPANQDGASAAGWRDLATPANLGWDCGQVTAGTAGFEARLPLETFLGGALPSTGTTLAVVVRLVNHDGQACSNQSLPPVGGETWTQNTVVEVPIR